MSAFTRAFLRCDGCDNNWDTSSIPSARTEGQARTEAARAGWHLTRDGRDLCPDCAPAGGEQA